MKYFRYLEREHEHHDAYIRCGWPDSSSKIIRNECPRQVFPMSQISFWFATAHVTWIHVCAPPDLCGHTFQNRTSFSQPSINHPIITGTKSHYNSVPKYTKYHLGTTNHLQSSPSCRSEGPSPRSPAQLPNSSLQLHAPLSSHPLTSHHPQRLAHGGIIMRRCSITTHHLGTSDR